MKGQETSLDIEAPEGLAVRLVFQDFDLETSPNCEGDAVTVSHKGLVGEWGAWEPARPLGGAAGGMWEVSLPCSVRLEEM